MNFSQPSKSNGQLRLVRPTRNYRSGCLGFVSSMALFAAGTTAAVAQDDGGDDLSRASGSGLGQIVVTARKVEENLQETPIAITALTGDMLEERQLASTVDIADVTPNLQFTNAAPFAANNAQSVVFIRGIGQVTPTANIDPGVGLYIDDVYIGQSVGGTLDFRDIKSVQVLRGPQGTLFGRNTIGGAIVITTNDPEPQDGFSGTARAGFGTDNLRDAFLALNVPLGDDVGIRATFGTRMQDGYVYRPYDQKYLGDHNSWTGTFKFLARPSPDMTIRIGFDYTHADENGVAYKTVEINEGSTFPRVVSANAGCPGLPSFTTGPVPLIDDPRCANDFLIGKDDIRTNYGTAPTRSVLDAWGVSLNSTYDLSSVLQLKLVGAYRDISWEGSRDPDGTPYPILHTDYVSDGWQVSGELQLVYESDALRGVVGAYYYKEEIDDVPTITLAPPPAPTGVLDSDNNMVRNHNFAVFGQFTYDLTDALSLTLGGRYTWDTKGSIPDQFSYANPSVKYLPVMLYERTFKAFTGSASLAYQFTPDLMAYASFSQGFKGGGWNSNFNAPVPANVLAELQSFDAEKANTYEIGLKSEFLDQRVRFNAAAFHTDYDDLQFTYRYQVAPLLANAGKANIEGFEIEISALPADGLTIDGSVGYLKDDIIEVSDLSSLGVVTGVTVDSDIPFTPEWTWSFGIGYESDPGPLGLVFKPRVDVSHVSPQFFDAQNTVEIAQNEAVTLLNASLGIENADGNVRFRISGRNLTNEIYSIGGNSSLTTGSGYAEAVFVRGREIVASIGVDF